MKKMLVGIFLYSILSCSLFAGLNTADTAANEYTQMLQSRLKAIQSQMQNLKPVTAKTVADAKAAAVQRQHNLSTKLKNIAKALAHAKSPQKEALNNQKNSLQADLDATNKLLTVSDAQFLKNLQEQQEAYKKRLALIEQKLQESLQDKAQLAKNAALYNQHKAAEFQAFSKTVAASQKPILATSKKPLLEAKSHFKPNSNPPTANLFMIEPTIAWVDMPDEDSFKMVLNQQKYALRNTAIPVAQWLPVIDVTPSAPINNPEPLISVAFNTPSTKFNADDLGFFDKKTKFIDAYKQSITGTGPRSMNITDQKLGLMSFDTNKKGYLTVEPVCLSAGFSSPFSTLLVQNVGGNSIAIYNANAGSGNDNIFAYQFDLQKLWNLRNEFQDFLFTTIAGNFQIFSMSNKDFGIEGLFVASVNFKIAFNIVTTELEVTPYFAFAGKADWGPNYALFPSLEIQDLMMPKIKQWLNDKGIITVIPNLSADKSLAALINYPCSQPSGN